MCLQDRASFVKVLMMKTNTSMKTYKLLMKDGDTYWNNFMSLWEGKTVNCTTRVNDLTRFMHNLCAIYSIHAQVKTAIVAARRNFLLFENFI